jgi:hypothetical protein
MVREMGSPLTWSLESNCGLIKTLIIGILESGIIKTMYNKKVET